MSGIAVPMIFKTPLAMADDTCKWEQESCGFLHGHREVCVITGDGTVCNCGDVTRPCDKKQ